ncbi:GLUG motif-containing protein [Anaerovorax odorimutans]|uniref:GLUG motif-containing protein n=1 Tax=Anaerovorax odorimutans TaxID=109327 RepID=UPI000405A906|nr:GLUG motif-containing protein [Anaerovorax odorimutans]
MKVKMRIHRRLAILMGLCMVISLMPAMPVMAETVPDTSVWSGSAEGDFPADGGTEGNPYIIKTAEQLAYLAQQVKDGTDYAGKYFELQNDIVLNENVLNGAGELNAEGTTWTPMGNEAHHFTGNFNGRGHSIKGIYIKDGSLSYVGLFGYTDNATIENLHIEDSYIYGKNYVGGVVGRNDSGSISNCSNSGTIDGDTNVGGVAGYNIRGSISNSSNSGKINARGATANYAGGIIGWNNINGSISNCSNSGKINGARNNIGGITGANRGSISNSSNSGTVKGNGNVGGVVGYNEGGSISNSSNSGTVSGSESIGGVVGESGQYKAPSAPHGTPGTPGNISNSSNSGEVKGKKQVGGIAGINGRSKIVSCRNSGAVKQKQDGAEGLGQVGGIAGDQTGTTADIVIENCSNSGSISGEGGDELRIGGITGRQNGTIQYCSNSGSVSGSVSGESSTLEIGGLIGWQESGTIQYCSNSDSISGTAISVDKLYIGELIGKQDSGTIDSCFYKKLDDIRIVGKKEDKDVSNCHTLDIVTDAIETLNGTDNQEKWITDAKGYPMVAISQMQLQLEDVCLDDVTYKSSETKSITYKVTNTGNTKIKDLIVNLSGADFEESNINPTGLEPNETAEFTVSLKAGKAVGIYTASIDVSGNVDALGESIDGETLKTTELSFSQNVNKATSKLSEIEATDETIEGFKDGSLTNVTTEMEYMKYKEGEEGTYTSITDTDITEDETITGLAPGTYSVRYQDSFADNYEGENMSVTRTINKGVAAIYKLELTTNDSFQDLTYGYEKGNSATYTITNAGNTTVSALTVSALKVSLPEEAKADFKVSDLNVSKLEPSETATFTITFQSGKPAGSYEASIDVSGKTPPLGDEISTNTSITQKVNKAASKLSQIGKTNETIKGSGDGSLTNLTTEMEYKKYKEGEEGTYTSITETDITEDGTLTELAPGTYYVRYQSSFADNYEGDNTPVALTIEEPRYELKLEGDSSLPVLTYGYEKGNSVTYTVTNAGNTTDSGLKVDLSGDAKDAFEVVALSATELAPNATANFTVTLKSGKEIGTYTAELKVESNTTSASLTITQQVKKSSGGSSSGGHSHSGGSTVGQTEPATQEENPSQNETPKSLETVKKDGAEKAKSFKDVKENSWYYEGTAYALGSEWFAGTTKNTFSPNNSMTREMFRIVLGRMGADVNDLMDNDRLKENITREQLATLLYRMAQEKELVKTGSQNTQNISNFTDYTQVSAWAKEAMAWANAQDIIKGDDKNMLKPKSGASRAEVVVILMRFDTIIRDN